MNLKRFSLTCLSIGPGLGLMIVLIALAVAAAQIDLVGPPGSGAFGAQVTVLPNGNLVVSDPSYDLGGLADVGAVYLYDGASGALISKLTGSTAGDRVGSDGVTVLANGNYLVSSPDWDNRAGAVTWGSETSGVSGEVSALNSLVGSAAGDQAGSGGVTELTNGNYVVISLIWNNGAVVDAGAITWGSGTGGVSGEVSALNSLVGSSVGDLVGSGGVTALTNGNYVVCSPHWGNDAGAITWGSGVSGVSGEVSALNSLVGSTVGDQVGGFDGDMMELTNGNYLVQSPSWGNGTGAVTWGSGTSGLSGVVSAINSLVGSSAGDQVGNHGLMALANGSYVVISPFWDNGAAADAGAVTWGSGTSGVTGEVSALNSLVGSTIGDWVGCEAVYYSDCQTGGVRVLANGNYVVISPYWDNEAVADAGAVTWGSGTSGVRGVVSVLNSLVGSSTDDRIGYYGVVVLANGNYLVRSPKWDNGSAVDAGAVTWGSGASGVSGVISALNSLVGSTAGDQVGFVEELTDDNYVVFSFYWDNGSAVDAGAVTWSSGTGGVSGEVSALNSLVGSSAGDRVGELYVTELANGNYVVTSPFWNNGAMADAGAVTWGSGTSGVSGEVSALNSLVGSSAGDHIGFGGVEALANGNYVVRSPHWNNGVAVDAGAVTWGSGMSGVSGGVSASNSLVGSSAGDQVSGYYLATLANGNYVVSSPLWDNGAAADAGAVTLGDGYAGTTYGPVAAGNSVVGAAAGSYWGMGFTFDELNGQLVVGRPGDNIVSLYRPDLTPLANAGADQTAHRMMQVRLDGSGSRSPYIDQTLAFDWIQDGGPPVALSSATAASPTFIAPAVVTQTIPLTFTLVVTNTLGLASAPDQVVVRVEPNFLVLPLVSRQASP